MTKAIIKICEIKDSQVMSIPSLIILKVLQETEGKRFICLWIKELEKLLKELRCILQLLKESTKCRSILMT
jgi:hypothetical protein